MDVRTIFNKLRELNHTLPKPVPLHTEVEVNWVEDLLGIKFPPSYRLYLLEYADVYFGTFELCHLHDSPSDYRYLMTTLETARQFYHLPEHLIPFLEDNADFYCFDLQTAHEYKVKFWSHNDGAVTEEWENFADWVERCWIGEHLEDDVL
jgi:hypothetical protein